MNVSKKTRTLTILTLNVRGMRSALKRKKLMIWAVKQRADILLFQETYLDNRLEYVVNSQFKMYEVNYSHGERKARGVCTAISKRLPISEIESKHDQKGRMLWVNVKIEDVKLQIVNVYAPNDLKTQKKFFKKLQVEIAQNKVLEGVLCVGGDFNISLSRADRLTMISRRFSVIDEVYSLASRHELVDLWRYCHPNKKQYTWSREKMKIASRLDYWLVPSRLLNKIKKCSIVEAVQTDHKAVVWQVESPLWQVKGPGIWRFNDSFLNEEEFNLQAEVIIKKSYKQSSGNAIREWLALKTQIAQYARKYGKEKARKLKEYRTELETNLNELVSSYNPGKWQQSQQTKLDKMRAELEKWYSNAAKASMFHNKVKWQRLGEKNSKYFFRLETQRYNNIGINAIQNKEGEITREPKEINNVLSGFWGELYSAKQKELNPGVIETYLEGLPKISETQLGNLEKELTLEECEKALYTMVDGKAPGEDGLTAAFYKKHWKSCRVGFMKMVNQAYKEGGFPVEMNTGVLRLLPKPNKDLLQAASWRPICLQGVDIKIVAKALATRLKEALNDVIHEDQVGFRAGKYIGETLQFIMDLIDEAEKQSLQGFILSLDIEKAFDSVEWPYLDEVLVQFGFGEKFRKWMKVLRKDSCLKNLNNGWASKTVQISRGVRQGDPLSPYLFLLSIEPLAIRIRATKEIHGIRIGEIEYKLNQYADDTTLYLQVEESFKVIPTILDRFSVISGYRNNAAKTKVMGIGKYIGVERKIGEFEVKAEPVMILGLNFEPDLEKMRAGNMGGKIVKMKKVLEKWFNRSLTAIGKLRVAKTLALSILTYPIMNLYTKEKELKQVEKLIYQFIWGGKGRAKIRKEVMMAPIKFGGLNTPDLVSQNLVWKWTWLERLQRDPQAKWSRIIRRKLEKWGGVEYLLKCNYSIKNWGIRLRKFWEEIFHSHALLYNKYKVDSVIKIREQIINNNQYILIDGSSFHKQKLINGDIDVVGNWFHWNGRIKTVAEIKALCPSITWLEYCQIVAAIPTEWKKVIRSRQVIATALDPHPVTKKEVKQAYRTLRYQKFEFGKKWDKALHELGGAAVNWESQTKKVFQITKEVKLQFFQYKILTKIVYTPRKALLFKKSETDMCVFCKKEVGSLIHMYAVCGEVTKLYRSFIGLFNKKEKTSA